VVHAHIKDYNGTMHTPDNRRQYLHPGEGDIDFPTFFKRLRERGFAGNVSLEASVVGVDGSVDMGKLQGSLAKLRELANGKE
jgi:sugar phosphate isomerase/epimerase